MIPSRYMAIPLDAENRALKERISELEYSIKQTKTEIKKIYNEEKSIDLRWAQGLKYSLHIMDKYIKGEN